MESSAPPLAPEVWEATPPESLALIVALQAEVQELRARLGQDSSNSSRLPSSDPPQASAKVKALRKAVPSGRNRGGFQHSGWLVPYFDEKIGEIMTEWTTRAGAFLMGRRTYEIFAGSWPKATDPADEIATALNTRPKYVASRTLERLDWNNSFLIKGDVVEAVAKLKAQEGGEIQVHGSSNLLQTLLKSGLIDTLRIW